MNLKLALTVVVFSLAQPSAANAQSMAHAARSAARELAFTGKALLAEGKYAEALDAFNRADSVMHLPSLGLEAARCLVKLDRWVEASERFRAVARMEYEQAALSESQRAVHEQAKQDAEREGHELGPKIPSLTIVIAGGVADVAVFLDDARLPAALTDVEIPVDPGQHLVSIERGAWKAVDAVAVKPGEKARVKVAMPASRKPMASETGIRPGEPLAEMGKTPVRCPQGASWEGEQCVAREVRVQCPSGSVWNGLACVGARERGEGADAAPRRPMRAIKVGTARMVKIEAGTYWVGGQE
jgi:hypothetical protein